MNDATNSETKFQIESGNGRLISIGLLAKSVTSQTGIRCTPQMIYNYEKHGLIHHSSQTKGGHRQFTLKDIQTVSYIKRLQTQGLYLSQIQSTLNECPEGFFANEAAIELPADRRAQLLAAAAKVFLRKGYQATTFKEISEEGNISSGSIYQYYKNKEELFLSFTENMSFGKYLAHIDATLDDLEKISYEDVRQALIDVAIHLSRDLKTNVDFSRIVLYESRQFPEIGQGYLRRMVAPMENLLEHYFIHLVNKGIFKKINPKLAVKAYFGIWVNISLLRDYYVNEELIYIPDEDEFSDLVDVFLRGMYRNPSG